ncbi:MAG: ABC transporter ATP-binding protein [Clostridia bacterium]|nr:ABC transporter ATP-binding protein [Clostridia bacterium]
MRLFVSKSYGEKRVLHNLSLELVEGEITCVLGASGVGKTTLLNILAGLTTFEGEAEVPENVGYIFQTPRLLPNLTVAQNLAFAGSRYEDIACMLEKVGLVPHKDKRPKMLSGGEKQRVAIARAFLSNAPLLLLDEPFSSLDTALKIRLCELFCEVWQERKVTAVMVTHDIEEALMLGHRIVVLKDGGVALDIRPKRKEFPAKYGAACKEREELLRFLLP